MAVTKYTSTQLRRLQGAPGQAQIERRIIDTISNDKQCAEVLRVRSLATVEAKAPLSKSSAHRVSAAQDTSTESDEPIRLQLDGQDGEWKLGDRSVPETETSKPKPAPPELLAQANEGFQQFYKAVASPTHVRVTAGGRIVPNTRGTSSPTGKLFRERIGSDNGNLPRPTSQGTGVNLADSSAGHFMPPPNMFPGFGQFPQPVPGMAFPMPPFALPFPPMVAPMAHGSQSGMSYQHAAASTGGTLAARDEPGSSETVPAQNPRDPAGRHLAPLGPYPPPFLPAPHFLPMPVHISMPMLHPQQITTHSGSSAISHATQPMPFAPVFGPMHYPTSALQHSMGFPTPFNPAMGGLPHNIPGQSQGTVSSIRMSEVTRKQIDGFRAHLKWVNDQIHFNKHQIDEMEMQQRANTLRAQIYAFERTLGDQLAAEQPNAPEVSTKSEAAKDSIKIPTLVEELQRTPVQNSASTHVSPTQQQQVVDSVSVSGGGTLAHVHDLTTNVEDATSRNFPNTFQVPEHSSDGVFPRVRESTAGSSFSDGHRLDVGKKGAYKKDRSKSKAWNSKTKAKLTNSLVDDNDEANNVFALTPQTRQVESEPVKKSTGLPKSAALAPPFQPRNQQCFDTSPEQTSVLTESSKYETATSVQDTESTPRVGSDSLHQNGPVIPSLRTQDILDMPYLEGRLPMNVDPLTAKDQDYVYSRQLTDDEIRARYLYWGKAPQSVMRGLPRYDGRDFYPPSPAKEDELSHASRDAALPLGNIKDYRADFLPVTTVDSDPFAALHDKSLLQKQLEKHEKRFTKSDNVDAGDPQVLKERSRARHVTSLISEDVSDTAVGNRKDETSSSGSVQIMGPPARSSDSDSSHELLFSGRRNMQHSSRNEIWKRLGKKNGAVSANALPGAMSSTTAHGFLPQYAGSAAASLTPAMAQATLSTNLDMQHAKTHEHRPETMGVSLAERVGENKPPTGQN